MGIVRTFLAFLVVLGHINTFDLAAWPPMGGGATVAVNLFFVMSGFYMALVLDTKYTANVRAFYKARALRLYPLYLVTIIASLAVIYSTDSFLASSVRPNIGRLFSGDAQWYAPLAIFTNLTFFGLDLGGLVCQQGHAISTALNPNCQPLAGFTVVPQAWSLGIEVLFYLIIPFILRAGWAAIAGAIVISLSVNVALISLGLYHAPWHRMLFLAVLIYFMLGVVAYFAYAILTLPDLARHRAAIIGLMVFALFLYGIWLPRYWQPWPNPILEVFLVLAFAACLPALFSASRDSKIDRWIGELSYPIYITHVATLALSTSLLGAGPINGFVRTVSHLTFVFAVATAGVLLVTLPMEGLRKKSLAVRSLQAGE